MPIPEHLTPIVEIRKLTDYLLKAGHPEGGPKANFLIKHGFAVATPVSLAEAIKAAARSQTIRRIEPNRYGAKYVLQCEIDTPSGRRPCVQTVWIDEGDGQARFVTLVPRAGRP